MSREPRAWFCGAGCAFAITMACTPQQVTNVTNAVFTADQAACLAANTGLLGSSTVVQDLEAACQITTPQFDQAVQTFVTDLTLASAKKKAAK